ncbi:hypothetical protein M422DRAFT_54412 [Sphaerobolus stellatus SS14]|uniref:non-specific serine/threonine protein kinase n=1 Tax=Sphaerobolus stellatus (strain SS14) TaxID=990650 RepID=A0A0C9UUG5_SPHS4|nr:hypothetical protein M422DRAFT_54412 [Sphaerobolus stellatus SS14]
MAHPKAVPAIQKSYETRSKTSRKLDHQVKKKGTLGIAGKLRRVILHVTPPSGYPTHTFTSSSPLFSSSDATRDLKYLRDVSEPSFSCIKAAGPSHSTTSHKSSRTSCPSLKRNCGHSEDEEVMLSGVICWDKWSNKEARCFKETDIEVGKVLGEGSNGHVNVCHLRARRGVDHVRRVHLPRKYKAENGILAVQNECVVHEELTMHIPDAIIPCVGRLYKRLKVDHEAPSTVENTSSSSKSSSEFVPKSSPKPDDATHEFVGFVMEHMPTDLFSPIQDLSKMYRVTGTLGLHPHVVWWYIIELLKRLHQVHDQGYFHGDIKPENVMVDTGGHLRLADFRSARLDIEKNWNYHVAGTSVFMPPEYFTFTPKPFYGRQHPGDLWAVGVIMHEMLFGRTPFNGASDTEVFRNIVDTLEKDDWPVISWSEPCCEEKMEACDFMQCFLNSSPGDRIYWDIIEDHPWVRDQWQGTNGVRSQPPLAFNGKDRVAPEEWRECHENYYVEETIA